MLELILRHEFSSLLPLRDLSENNANSVDQNVVHVLDGPTSTGGYYQFNGSSSRVSIPFSTIWQNLTFIQIDAEIWIDTHGKRHNVVEGLLSFSLYVRASGVLSATIYGLTDDDSFIDTLGTQPADPSPPAGGIAGTNSMTANLGVDPDDPDSGDGPIIPAGKKLDWVGVNSDTGHAPDGVRRLVPVGQWVSVSFIRDAKGFRLYIDGTLVGERTDEEALVRSVQGAPIVIGAWPNSDAYTLAGRVRKIEIWKYDHSFRFRAFLCGFKDGDERAYAVALYAKLIEAIGDEETRNTITEVLTCLNAAEEGLLKAIRTSGDDKHRIAEEGFARYSEIWCAGDPGSTEMDDFMEDFIQWLMRNFGDAFLEYQCRVAKCLMPLREIGLCDDAAQLRQSDIIRQFSKMATQAHVDAMDGFLCGDQKEVGASYDEKRVDPV
ncbi:MAG: LamG-like jellyroll fold domain-containing protein [Pseudomonadota bacterium]